MNSEFARHAMSAEAAAELRGQWGKRIGKARRAQKMTRNDLAAAVGVSATAVGMWERGETAPRPLLQGAIAEVLKREHAELFPLVTPRRRGGGVTK